LSQPYAFVADKVEVCQLSLDLSEVMGRGVATEGWEALLELRDQIAPGEKVSWWVVYNGDEKREFNDEIGNESIASSQDDSSKKKGKLRRFIK